MSSSQQTRVALIAPQGLMGSAWCAFFRNKPEFQLIPLGRAELNLTNPTSFEQALAKVEFDWLINCAAYTSVDDCEVQGDLAFLVNSHAPGMLAKIAARREARMLHFSTDFVFNGFSSVPYTEQAKPNPISVYGQSKLGGEMAVLAASGDHLVVRLSWLFGHGRPAFPEWLLAKSTQVETVDVIGDKIACPSYAPAVAEGLAAWLLPEKTELPGGIVHYCNGPATPWAAYAEGLLAAARSHGRSVKATQIRPVPMTSLPGLTAKRPLYSALSTELFSKLTGSRPPDWPAMVERYFADHNS